MIKERLKLAARIWFLTNLFFDAGLFVYIFINPAIGTVIIIPGLIVSPWAVYLYWLGCFYFYHSSV
jgi:hypothetical protein